jgi:hypothetical protein
VITHRYKLADIEEAYHLFENKLDGVIKVTVEPKFLKETKGRGRLTYDGICTFACIQLIYVDS